MPDTKLSFNLTSTPNTAGFEAMAAAAEDAAARINAAFGIPPVVTPVVDGAPAEAELEGVQAAAEATAAEPVVITPIVDPAAAIAGLEAVTAAEVAANEEHVALTVEKKEVDEAAAATGTLRDGLKGVGGAAREFSAVMNGSVSGAARAGGTSAGAAGSQMGMLGLAIGAVAVGLPILVKALQGGETQEQKIAEATEVASSALDKNTAALLKNKDALAGIKTEADAAKTAQDQIDQALLGVASKVKISSDQMSTALGSIGKSPIDIEPIIKSVQQITQVQLDAAATLKDTNLSGTGISVQKLAEAQVIAQQISGLTQQQANAIAELSTGISTATGSIGSQLRDTLVSSGLSTTQIDQYTDAVKKLNVAADVTDFSKIIGGAQEFTAGSNDAYAAALKLAEQATGIQRTTTDAAKAQTLYNETLRTYAALTSTSTDDQSRMGEAARDGASQIAAANVAIAASVGATSDAYTDYQQAVREATAPTESFTQRLGEQTDAENAAEQGLLDEADAFKKVSDAARAAADDTFALKLANDKVATAQADFNKAMKDAGKNVEKQDQATSDLVNTLAAAGDAAQKSADDQAAANDQTLTAAQNQAIWNQSLLTSAATLKGTAQKAASDYIATVNQVPKDKLTEFEADIAKGDLAAAQKILDDAAATRTAKIEALADPDSVAAAMATLDAIAKERQATISVSATSGSGGGGGYLAPGQDSSSKKDPPKPTTPKTGAFASGGTYGPGDVHEVGTDAGKSEVVYEGGHAYLVGGAQGSVVPLGAPIDGSVGGANPGVGGGDTHIYLGGITFNGAIPGNTQAAALQLSRQTLDLIATGLLGNRRFTIGVNRNLAQIKSGG